MILFRSKVKLTTRDLKLALKQATILIEDFYPSHVLNRIVYQLGAESTESDMGAVLSQLDAIHGRNASGPKNVGILDRSISKTGSRKSGLHEHKFATVEEWWDSKGLAVGELG